MKGLVVGVAALWAAAPALAQPAGGFAAYSPSFEATRIERAEAPQIDGDLSDAAWSKAAVVEEFYQVEPTEGGTPSQKTRAYIMYDDLYLYVGVYNFDDEPNKIIHKVMERDGPLQTEDAVRVMIDSFGTRRDGYFFGTNPNGVRTDGLIENNNLLRIEWNTIWNVKSRIVEDGWIAEYAIPFRSISFDASLKEWGFQLLRTIARNNEEIRWSNVDRTRDRIDITNAGRVSGIADISSGIGLEAQIFVTGSSSYDWELDTIDADFNPSGNFFYKFTPSLTGSLTFNTDFADAPLDERQVNTGRFSLFFPETRDFFLQDAAVFEFGGRVYQDNPNGLPFFTRRIGIVDGTPVDIVAGAKLSGKLGPANVGLISARTGSAGIYDGQFLSAARVSIPVLAESKAGVVFTHGDPAGGADNTVAGVDFQYKNTRRWEGTLYADMSHQRSIDDGDVGSMTAFDVAYRGLKWNWTLRLQDIDDDYIPRLGFANRTGIRRYNMNAWRAYRPANGFIRNAETGMWVEAITDRNDTIEDNFWGAWAFAQTDDGDEGNAEYEHGYVDIRAPFDIAGEVPVAAGKYRFDTFRLRAATSRSRPIAASAEVKWGGVYDGDFFQANGGLQLQPSRHFQLGADYSYTEFDLPSGAVGIHVIAVNTSIVFTPDMVIRTDVQYDNISESFTFFSRLIWEPTPEREVFISFGHTALIDRTNFPDSFRAQGSNVAVRLGQTMRF
jgi:hypothetical protein